MPQAAIAAIGGLIADQSATIDDQSREDADRQIRFTAPLSMPRQDFGFRRAADQDARRGVIDLGVMVDPRVAEIATGREHGAQEGDR
jgi:hypothetical protein